MGTWTPGPGATSGDDTFVGDDGVNETASGLAGDDVLLGGDGDDILDGGTGVDVMIGGLGNDTYFVDRYGEAREASDPGIDTVRTTTNVFFLNLSPGIENVVFVGSGDFTVQLGNALSNQITGGSGNDRLYAGDGADSLFGGAGIDVFQDIGADDSAFGGADDDGYFVVAAGATIAEDADAGIDQVTSAMQSWTLGANFENLGFTGVLDVTGIGNSLANEISGSAGDDILIGGGGADYLVGSAGDDLFRFFSGDVVAGEEIRGGGGNDELAPGERNTLATNGDVNFALNQVVVRGISDLLFETAGVVTLSIHHVDNSGALNVTGSSGADRLVILIGQINADVSDLTFANWSAVDLVELHVENYGAGIVVGTEAADLFIQHGTGGARLEGAGGDDTITGGVLSDELFGDADDDTLDGGGGGDALDGGDGADFIDGGEGDDVISGGDGVDTLGGNSGADTVRGEDGNDHIYVDAFDTVYGGVGDDTYHVTASGATIVELDDGGQNDRIELDTSASPYMMGDNIEWLVFTGVGALVAVGNASDNFILGGAGNDTLDGLTGLDWLYGGAGDDTYIVNSSNDQVAEQPGDDGVDLVKSTASWTLGADLENLTLTGSRGINGTGNTLANVIIGNGAANTLRGFAGADTLDGAGGADHLYGGDGDDTYLVNDVTDQLFEDLANGGVDLVKSSVDWTLGDYVEKLTLAGSAALNGTGNALANVIYGNSGANILDGGSGVDTMIGGGGDDTYIVNGQTDQTIESSAAGGTDLVKSTANWTLGANLENLTLLGTKAVNGTGNALNNIIVGNGAANTLSGSGGADSLSGGAGADVLIGGTGHDTLTGGTGADAFVFASGSAKNSDTITDFAVGVDKIRLDNAVFAELSEGPLSGAAFYAGASAHDGDDRVIYNAATGALYYDGDGNGAGRGAILLATLTTHPALTAGDFVVI